MPEDWRHGGFGLYVHWPFCQAKCPYCDFNSHVAQHIDQSRWQAAYLSEIERYGQMTRGRVLQSVFFGGGTPSLMEPEVVDAILTKVRATWPTANDMEVTLEANPTSVEAGRFAGYRDAGVNRVSMGIQALNDPDLKALGRLHTAEEALRAFEIARTIFDQVSFDLIYARQGQTLDAWKRELALALSLAVDHLSVYQLTIEDGTAFGDRHALGKLKGLPDEDLGADMYFATQDICDAHGFGGYEVSNHAKSGRECRHNLIYWRSGDYIGIGPGAHGRVTLNGTRHETVSVSAPGKWLACVEANGGSATQWDGLTPQAHLTEFLLMGLRLTEGVSKSRLEALGGDTLLGNIENLIDSGYLEPTTDAYRITPLGRPVLNGVLREILGD